MRPGPAAARALGAAAAATALLAAPVTHAAGGELDGRWVLVSVTVTSSDVPLMGQIEAKRRSVTLYDLMHADGHLRGNGSLCKLEVDSGTKLVSTKYPAAYLRALPAPTLDALVSSRDGGGYTFVQGKQTVLLGAKLEHPTRDALPEDEADPRVVDQDGDGEPGVTIEVSGLVSGRIYLGSRTTSWLTGLSTDTNQFAGSVAFDHAQVVYGASSPLLADPPDAIPVRPKSVFRLVRLAPSATCAEANALAATWQP